MTPDPTLTDEELAEMEGRWPAIRREISYTDHEIVPRLIAALRASRQQLERLRAANDLLRNGEDGLGPY